MDLYWLNAGPPMMQWPRYAKKLPEMAYLAVSTPITFHFSDKPSVAEGLLDSPGPSQISILSIRQARLVCRPSMPRGGSPLW